MVDTGEDGKEPVEKDECAENVNHQSENEHDASAPCPAFSNAGGSLDEFDVIEGLLTPDARVKLEMKGIPLRSVKNRHVGCDAPVNSDGSSNGNGSRDTGTPTQNGSCYSPKHEDKGNVGKAAACDVLDDVCRDLPSESDDTQVHHGDENKENCPVFCAVCNAPIRKEDESKPRNAENNASHAGEASSISEAAIVRGGVSSETSEMNSECAEDGEKESNGAIHGVNEDIREGRKNREDNGQPENIFIGPKESGDIRKMLEGPEALSAVKCPIINNVVKVPENEGSDYNCISGREKFYLKCSSVAEAGNAGANRMKVSINRESDVYDSDNNASGECDVRHSHVKFRKVQRFYIDLPVLSAVDISKNVTKEDLKSGSLFGKMDVKEGAGEYGRRSFLLKGCELRYLDEEDQATFNKIGTPIMRTNTDGISISGIGPSQGLSISVLGARVFLVNDSNELSSCWGLLCYSLKLKEKFPKLIDVSASTITSITHVGGRYLIVISSPNKTKTVKLRALRFAVESNGRYTFFSLDDKDLFERWVSAIIYRRGCLSGPFGGDNVSYSPVRCLNRA